ncbi:hypothetical protein D3C76_1225300 [compost metagenome]
MADGDFDLLGENIAYQGTGKHRCVYLLAVGHQGITGQWVVMFPTGQGADAPDGAVDGTQTRTIALPPDHAFVVGRGDFASMLNQATVGIEEQLRVVDRAAIALVDADGDDHSCLFAGLTDRQCGGGRHGDRLIEQFEVLCAHGKRRLHKRKIRVVRHHRFREHGELHALSTEGDDLLADLVHGAFAAVKHRADLYGGCANNGHDGS